MVLVYWFGLLNYCIWTVIWKGLALWKSAHNKQMRWFVFLLVLNTAGILEIIYIIWFQKHKKKAYFWSKK